MGMTVLIMTTVAMIVFAILIIMTRQPILKLITPIRLKPARAVIFGQGVFVLTNGSVWLSFVKNLGVRISVGEARVWIKFCLHTSFSIAPNRMIIRAPNLVIEIDKSGVKFDCAAERDFCLEFAKPEFAFCLDSSRKTVTLGERDLLLSLRGFLDFGIAKTQGGKLRICGKITRSASITYNAPLATLSAMQLRLYKQQNFGIIDTDTWAVSPTFDSQRYNNLQVESMREKLDLSARVVSIPADFDATIMEPRCYSSFRGSGLIQLNSLGLSKVLRLKKVGKKLVIVDLLTNISIRLVCDAEFEYKLQNMWGQYYLAIQTNVSECGMRILPFYQYVDWGELPNESCLCDMYSAREAVSVDAAIRRLNLCVLHGYDVAVAPLVQSINYHFLPTKTRFLLANLVLSLIVTFPSSRVMRAKKLRRLLILGLDYAVGRRDAESVAFCKKILPIVRNERAHQRINLSLPAVPCAIDSADNEYRLTTLLGIGLAQNILTVAPTKHEHIDTAILLRGKKLRLSICPDWHSVNINDLRLNNICTFDIDKLADNTLLAFD